ncbi:6-phosphogluconolactonase [Spongiimicrobium salis]|uniref:6-phosphogluconolactonase n=1 Tax=Spongiimicrobium salis TaxID=1667022 RepID=UPI00374D10A0
MELKIYDTKADVAQYFSAYLAQLIATGETVHIALSGGSTPKIVFDRLAADYGDSTDWSKVHLYWGDERCVLPTDDESNYKMTLTHLLSKIKIPEANIHRVFGEKDPKEEAVRYGKLLQDSLPSVHSIPQFDLVILGMGDDGHTASIFPHEIELWHSEEFCEVAVHPDSGQKRISLTGKIINNAKKVSFLVTGGGKAEKVREILNAQGDYTQYPATLVAPTSGDLVWFLDADAACELKE